MPLDSNQFRQIMGGFPTGVTIVTTAHGGTPHGMTANAITSVSLDPLLMLFCARKTTRTHAMIQQSGVFVINFLTADMTALSDRFAGRTGPEDQRFAGVACSTAGTGAPILAGALGWLDCRLVAAHDGGDHTIFVGEVVDGGTGTGAPLVFHRGQYTTVAA